MQNINKGFGLLFEMGCGKTLTAIAIAGRRLPDGKGRTSSDCGTDLRRGCMAKGAAGVRKIQVYLQDAPGRKEAAHKADR